MSPLLAPVNPATLRSRRRRALMTANERTKERSMYARRRRLDLIAEIAPDLRCAECNEQFAANDLTVDHVDGREWMLDELSPSMRVARYWREHKAGVRLRALCVSCNSSTGGGRRYGYSRYERDRK